MQRSTVARLGEEEGDEDKRQDAKPGEAVPRLSQFRFAAGSSVAYCMLRQVACRKSACKPVKAARTDSRACTVERHLLAPVLAQDLPWRQTSHLITHETVLTERRA